MSATTREFRLTEKEFTALHDFSRKAVATCPPYEWPIKCAAGADVVSMWRRLGAKYGFVWESCRPAPGTDRRCFVAECVTVVSGSSHPRQTSADGQRLCA